MIRSASESLASRQTPLKIAIIGAGISGNMAAYLLHRHHHITLFEKRERLGGHSATVDISTPDGKSVPVDTGFIVYNELNYPGLVRLFNEIGVDTQASDMSFGFSADQGGFEWSGQSLRHVFAQKRNVLRPRFWRMLSDIVRFNRLARAGDQIDPSLPLDQWLAQEGFSEIFRQAYLFPMAAAIWSTPYDSVGDFPAQSLIQFFRNHRLVDQDRPVWRTVTGGSRNYVQKLTAPFCDRIECNSQIKSITRKLNGATLQFEDGSMREFDAVIFACHSDQAQALLGDATAEEQRRLGDIRYRPNDVYLHYDRSFMPQRTHVWSSWNYMATANAENVCVSYWMNRLQHIDPSHPVFVTLNPERAPDPQKTYGHFIYDHPQFDGPAIAAQADIRAHQGEHHTFFCGAWLGYGFHEDGLQSALDLLPHFGLTWDTALQGTVSEAAQ